MLARDNAAVRIPATSANLGPGFDCLGLALDLYLHLRCRRVASGCHITTAGTEGAAISSGTDNRVWQAMKLVFDAAGADPPGIELHINNAIPLSRGLGSSAAAAAGGAMLANHLLGEPFDKRALLTIALPLEGHPDNLAPALFGGLTVSTIADGSVQMLNVAMPRDPEVVLFVPSFTMDTTEARKVLPPTVPRADAIFNTGRASLFVAAMATGNFSLLHTAMEDRLHQPYRTGLFPALPRLIAAALQAGAAGAALSGAGSTVIALCDGSSRRVLAALEDEARTQGIAGAGRLAAIDRDGAIASESDGPGH